MKRSSGTKGRWLEELRSLVLHKPIAIFRFDEKDWQDIANSRRGLSHFTVARSHAVLEHVRAPTACLIFVSETDGEDRAFLALLSKRAPVSTLDTRVTIDRVHRILPSSLSELIEIVSDKALATNLRRRLSGSKAVVRLSPKLSVMLVERLAAIRGNRDTMRALISSVDAPRHYSGSGALQQDAINMALGAFGISSNDAARTVEIVDGRESALARVNVLEDAVIEHDARYLPPLKLVSSDITGRAVFEHHGERLEIITANKRPLEQVLGVDLIYLNVLKQNVVMVQYKMLESDGHDWIYRPDKQLKKEVDRMRRFGRARQPGALEYRINPQVFYLKFVRRDALLGKSSIIVPMDHYEILRRDPKCKGKRGAFRVTYESLEGRYLRQEPFLDLIRAGYIGAHATTTADLSRLVNAVLKADRAVVAAISSGHEPA